MLWLHGLRGVDPADPLLAALQKRYHVTAPVAPGFNDLDELSKIDNIHELALDYDDLIDASGLQDLILVGHSFGAMIAAEIAAHFPRRTKRLVLLAPFGLVERRLSGGRHFRDALHADRRQPLARSGVARAFARSAVDRCRRQGGGGANRQARAEPDRGDQVRLADPRPRLAPAAAADRVSDAHPVRRAGQGHLAALCRRLQGRAPRRPDGGGGGGRPYVPVRAAGRGRTPGQAFDKAAKTA